MTILDAASAYLDMGFSVIPLRPQSKKPAIKWKGYQSRLPTRDEIENWKQQFPNANIAIITGEISNLIVLDIDGQQGVDSVIRLGGIPNNTPIVRTGSGWQAYFSYPDFPVRNSAHKMPGLDLRAEGGYVVAPPSIHPNRRIYRWSREPAIDSLLSPPFELTALLRPPKPVSPPRQRGAGGSDATYLHQVRLLAASTEGTRNDQLNRAAYTMGGLVGAGRLNRAVAETSLEAIARGIGLTDTEIAATVKSGIERGIEAPLGVHN